MWLSSEKPLRVWKRVTWPDFIFSKDPLFQVGGAGVTPGGRQGLQPAVPGFEQCQTAAACRASARTSRRALQPSFILSRMVLVGRMEPRNGLLQYVSGERCGEVAGKPNPGPILQELICEAPGQEAWKPQPLLRSDDVTECQVNLGNFWGQSKYSRKGACLTGRQPGFNPSHHRVPEPCQERPKIQTKKRGREPLPEGKLCFI